MSQSNKASMSRSLRALALLAGSMTLAVPAFASETYTNDKGQTVECQSETTTTTDSSGKNSIIGTVAGGALGGLAGNQFGKGKGKTAMTAAGAVGGAYAGHEVAKDHYPDRKTTTTQNCHPVDR